MRSRPPEQFRITTGPMASTAHIGNNGMFEFDGPCGLRLRAIVSDGMGWDHVSVSCERLRRLPNWLEMCFVKDLFWHEEECVVQFHPPRSEYVDNAPVLHLWKLQGCTLTLPPSIMVGIKGIKL